MASLSEKLPVPTLYVQTPPSNNHTIDVIPPRVKEIWEEWNIRGLILFSLSLQTFLILCAPLRKRTSRKFPIFLLWSAYLLADWTASFIVGLISNNNSNDNNRSKSDANQDLLAFWAPFLLLHLGGPGTITAFALEDNALWLRHLIGLLFQVVATVYVFVQTLPRNKLWVPAILMFVAGIIKYAERTRALYLASLGSFRSSMLKEPDPGSDYAKLMEEFSCKETANLPTRIDLVDAPNKEWSPFTSTAKMRKLNQLEVVQYAFLYFNKFKGLIVDLIFSFRERDESRDFFLVTTPIDALKVIEVELNFLYEVLFTKVVVLHSICGWLFRIVSMFSVIAALILFAHLDKTDLKKIDVRITYALLIGAIALDLMSILMTVFSHWTAASLKKDDSCVATIFRFLLRLTEQRLSEHKKFPFSGRMKLDTPRIFRRWRESVSQFNLITYCLNERIPMDDLRNRPFCCGCHLAWNKMVRLFRRLKDVVVDYLGAKEFFDDWNYVSRQPVFVDLWTLIFNELQDKSRAAESAEVTEAICSSRGSYALKSMELQSEANIDELIPYIDNVAFDESIMLWHIATELCYREEQNNENRDQQNTNANNDDRDQQNTNANNDNRDQQNMNANNNSTDRDQQNANNTREQQNANDKTNDSPEFSKLLSDYMLYLLVMLPSMMSVVAGSGEIRFRDACAEVKKFFDRKGLECSSNDKIMKGACDQILRVKTIVPPVTVMGDRSKSVLFAASILPEKLKGFKGDRSKSVLFDASILAKKLKGFKDEKWKIMSKVWIEMLGYAASYCRPDQHVQQVSKGGELITLVWLLMAHFGLGEQFEINEGHARAKLIVDK